MHICYDVFVYDDEGTPAVEIGPSWGGNERSSGARIEKGDDGNWRNAAGRVYEATLSVDAAGRVYFYDWRRSTT